MVLDLTRGLKKEAVIEISGSKSESNRILLLSALSGGKISAANLSTSDDTQILNRILSSADTDFDAGHSGTALRFALAYLAIQQDKNYTLTGSERMKKRPIAPLVEALNGLGAEIIYTEKEGFVPLEIRGKRLLGGSIEIDGSVSSQFISALMLIAPALEKGLKIGLKGKTVSTPYIRMTLNILHQAGVEGSFSGSVIEIKPSVFKDKTITVEPDWSSASYFYNIVAANRNIKISLPGFRKNSFQGDGKAAEIYKAFGVDTVFSTEGIVIEAIKDFKLPVECDFDLFDTPDLAQSIAVVMAALKIKGTLSGLETLPLKETDRIAALCSELKKLNTGTGANSHSIFIKSFDHLPKSAGISTYHDHRMAMSFSLFSLFIPLTFDNPTVISKSFAEYWELLSQLKK